jgi:hypothetical protein
MRITRQYMSQTALTVSCRNFALAPDGSSTDVRSWRMADEPVDGRRSSTFVALFTYHFSSHLFCSTFIRRPSQLSVFSVLYSNY